jgi:hypothetical protein
MRGLLQPPQLLVLNNCLFSIQPALLLLLLLPLLLLLWFRCLEAGFDAWLAKPFRVEDLVKVIADSQARLQQSSSSSSGKTAAAAAGHR